MSVVWTNPPRVGRETAESFTSFGVATVHEAQWRDLLHFASRLLAESMLEHLHRLIQIEQIRNFGAAK